MSEVRWSIVRWWRPFPLCRPRTVVWNRQEWRRKYWATRSSVRSFARTAHSFACSGLLALLAPSAALTRSLPRSLRSLPRSWESEFLMSQNDLFLSHSAVGQSQYDFRLLTNSITHPSVHRPLLPLPADSQVASHYGQEQPRIKTQVLGHLHVCSLVRSHCSLIRLIRTARFVLLASLTRSAALTHARACR